MLPMIKSTPYAGHDRRLAGQALVDRGKRIADIYEAHPALRAARRDEYWPLVASSRPPGL